MDRIWLPYINRSPDEQSPQTSVSAQKMTPGLFGALFGKE